MDAMDELIRAQEAFAVAKRKLDDCRDARDAAARAAHARKFRPGAIAQVLGVSPGRVTQIVANGVSRGDPRE